MTPKCDSGTSWCQSHCRNRLHYDTDSFTGSLNADALAANAPLTPYSAQQYWTLVGNVVSNIEGSLGLTSTEGSAVIASAFGELTVPYSFADIQPSAGSYAFGAGDGQVTVDETGAAAGTLKLIGLNASDITLQANDTAQSIKLTIISTGDSITFTHDNWNAHEGDVIDFGYGGTLSSILFADSTSLALTATNGSSLLNFTWNGTASDTTLTGSNYGYNIFNVGPGGDTINAGAVGNTVNFTSGEGTASVAFTASYEANTFNFGSGDGNVTVDLNNTAVSTLVLGAGITASDIALQANDTTGAFTLTLTATGDSITFNHDSWNAKYGDVVDYGDASQLHSIHFADGSSIALVSNAGSLPTFTWNGTSTAATITGTNYGQNVFNVGSNGDTINAGAMGNTVNFTSGEGTASVSFTSSYAANTFNFGTGDGDVTVDLNNTAVSTLALGAGITASDVILQANDTTGSFTLTLAATGDSITFNHDSWNAKYGDVVDYGDASQLHSIQFADGSSIALVSNAGSLPTFTWTGTSSDTTLTGSNYAQNVFNLGAGGDTVNAGTMGNTFKFGTGDGNASVTFGTGTNYGTNTLDLGAGITASDVILQGNDTTGALSVLLDTGESITFTNDSWGAPYDDPIDFGDRSILHSIHFADGSSIALAGNAGNLPTFTWNATSSDITLTGSDYAANVFNFDTSGDTVNAGAMGNTLNFASGESTASVAFTASYAANSLNFGTGDGDVTVDLDNTAVSTLHLGTGITESDVLLQANDSTGAFSLILAGTGDSITFNHDSWNAKYGDVVDFGDVSQLHTIQFADSSSITLYNNAGTLPTLTWDASSSDTTLTGSNYAANIFNFDTSGDTVNAGAMGNVFNFASGEGTASVSFGASYASSTFNFGTGDGQVTADLNNTAVSTLVLSSGITESDVSLQANYTTGALSVLLDTGDSITFNHDSWGAKYGDVVDFGNTSQLHSIHFADGSSIALVNNAGTLPILTWNGTSSDTTLTGSNYAQNVFNLGTGGDTVNAGSMGNTINFATGQGNATLNMNGGTGNVLNFGSGIADTQLWLAQSGNDLDIDVIGTTDQITVANWYSGSSNQLQHINAGGLTLDTQVAQLVTAMATYSSNNSGFNPVTASGMPTDSTLQSAIAAAWHS